uniref:Uncharacterized protein n=1 Tax=Glossina brevipalpis TaxID=37001 RepID=A0A1A9WWM2_9MUSC
MKKGYELDTVGVELILTHACFLYILSSGFSPVFSGMILKWGCSVLTMSGRFIECIYSEWGAPRGRRVLGTFIFLQGSGLVSLTGVGASQHPQKNENYLQHYWRPWVENDQLEASRKSISVESEQESSSYRLGGCTSNMDLLRVGLRPSLDNACALLLRRPDGGRGSDNVLVVVWPCGVVAGVGSNSQYPQHSNKSP